MRKRTGARPWVLAALLLTGCAGGAGSGSVPGAAPPVPPVASKPSAGGKASNDDWSTFAHDLARTGHEAQATGIGVQNVGSLKLRWQAAVGASVIASPLVAGGSVYVAGMDGTVRSYDTTAGALNWQTAIGGPIRMTPTIIDGLLFAGTHETISTFAAIDIATGAVRWQVSLPYPLRSEPVVAGGVVYMGAAGGDPQQCAQGGVFALDEHTGALLWWWRVAPAAGQGGSVWSPLSFDGAHLFFGTGNTCVAGIQTANSVVALNLNGSLDWSLNSQNPVSDDDIGGGAMLYRGNVFVTGKNTQLYDIGQANGNLLWSRAQGGIDGFGGIGTPATDGTCLIASAGALTDPTQNPFPGGALQAYDFAGNKLWSVQSQTEYFGYAAINNGVAYATLDQSVVALDERSGARLWSYVSPGAFYASPVVVPSGLYAVDKSGNLSAFGL